MRYCNQSVYLKIIKKCKICEGNVHVHATNHDENGFFLAAHCHICGEKYDEWDGLEDFNDS